jgi:membrane protein
MVDEPSSRIEVRPKTPRTARSGPGAGASLPALRPSQAGRPGPRAATWQQIAALARYMTHTEVHTYAFSVAAQVILSLFPFIVLLLTLSQRVFHSTKMVDVVSEMMTNFLPNNQEFVMRNMRVLAFAHTRVRVFSWSCCLSPPPASFCRWRSR